MSSEYKDCEDHFCCIYLGQRTCPRHCRRQNCFCACCQLYHIEMISPAVYRQRCDFVSECYNYKHIGRVANRHSYILERYCVEHCPTPNCPHREAPTVNVSIPILSLYPSVPDYGKVLNDVNPMQKMDVREQGIVASQLEDRETPVPGPSGSANMGSAVSELIRRSSKRVLTSKVTQGTRGSTRRTRGSTNVGSKL